MKTIKSLVSLQAKSNAVIVYGEQLELIYLDKVRSIDSEFRVHYGPEDWRRVRFKKPEDNCRAFVELCEQVMEIERGG